MPGPPSLGPAHEYFLDACQRSILFLDVLRRRGNIYREQQEKSAPNVLEFEAELVLDGRKLVRPVNYGLVRISAPEGVETDPNKRPFVVVDPRAGHGPGIGGMKKDSEIGVVLANGHPCYFIGFLPEPMPDQTIEDVWTAEAEFVREVARRHPASGKPAVIGNCQAGWQTIIMAATNPDVPGPLLLAGPTAGPRLGDASDHAAGASRGDGSGPLDHIAIPVREGTRLVAVESVDWIEAADDYVYVHTGGRAHLLRQRLSFLEERLDRRRFVRIHRSTIVNLARVTGFVQDAYGAHLAVLATGQRLRVSRTRLPRLEARLGQAL